MAVINSDDFYILNGKVYSNIDNLEIEDFDTTLINEHSTSPDKTTCISIIDNDNNYVLVNDISDRQAIVEKVIELADLVNKVNIAIPTMASDPTVGASITQLKTDLNKIKQELK